MGSRIRNDVDRLYLCFCVISQPESLHKAAVIEKYPEEYADDQVLKSVPKFVFPCECDNTNIQRFSFVLTEANSKWTFGFCRHDPQTKTALVFLSYLPWLEIFMKVLNCVSELIKSSKCEELSSFLYILYNSRVPSPGTTLTVTYDNDKSSLVLKSPSQFELPSIPQNRNLAEYYNAVDFNNMLVIFASMLYERRIIIKSRRLSRFSACVQAANAIIYPMHWQHIYIPVLPKHLFDYLFAPMPFLIGVPSSIFDFSWTPDMGDIVVLDADTNALHTPFNDLNSIPREVVKFLRNEFRKTETLAGDGLARLFLKAIVQLIGGYRDALQFQQGQKITFSQEAFVRSRPSSMQPFLRDVLHLQIFQQFIEERLDLLNTGMGFSDEFEREVCNYAGKSSSKIKAQYKEYLTTMRTQGSAFLKTVKNKANPAVKSAVRTVKERGKDVKSAYKGIRSKMRRETTLFYDHTSQVGPPQPRSAPSSPTSNHVPKFGPKPSSVTTTYKKQIISLAPTKRSNEYAPLKPPCEDLISTASDPDIATKSDVLPRLNMDLMEDLQEVINRQFSISDKTDSSSTAQFRNLKPVRSLDSFQSHRSHPTTQIHAGSNSHNNSHSLLTSTLSLPVDSQSHNVPKMNPLTLDPFGFSTNLSTLSSNITTSHNKMNPFMPDIIQTSLKPNNSNVNDSNLQLFCQPPASDRAPPKAAAEQIKGTSSVGDLIRLDAVPQEDTLDPLGSSSNSSSSSSSGSSNDRFPFKTGLTNPLYPYYSLNGRDSNTDNKLFNSGVNANTSFLHKNTDFVTSRCDEQDLNLLKEYNLDFTSGTTKSHPSPVNKSSDPFESTFDSSKVIAKKDMQNNWATFD